MRRLLHVCKTIIKRVRKATVSFVMSACQTDCLGLSVCLSAHMEQLGSHWKDFH